MYRINIKQSRSFMSDNSTEYTYRADDILDIKYSIKHLTQIGKFPVCAMRIDCHVLPSGLEIVPFATTELEVKNITKILLHGIRCNGFGAVQLHLPDDKGGGEQSITIEKIEDSRRKHVL